MGKDCGAWLHQQHSAWQSPNLPYSRAPPDPGLQNTFHTFANPYAYMVSTSGTLPGFAVSELPHLKTDQSNGLHGWSYCLPHHQQAFTPHPDYIAKEKLSAFPYGCDWEATPNAECGSVQKRFLVFDQPGNQASSVIAPTIRHSSYKAPSPYPSSKAPSPFESYGLHELATRRDPNYQSGLVISDGLDESHESNRSEMHEDTEELNALLYSDEDDEGDDDDEETSTGRSPSDLAGYEKRKQVNSLGGPTKRRKLSDGEHEVSSLMDTASSVNSNGLWEYKDDADSSCVKGATLGKEMGSLLGDKSSRKEKIRETVSILQSIIPGGKGKDAVLVLDNAIQYLRSLKAQSQSSLSFYSVSREKLYH